MIDLHYIPFAQVDPLTLLPVLNESPIREHLVQHALFDADSVRGWAAGKAQADQQPGCRTRVILQAGHVVGWCGIQREGKDHELAIVLAQASWGCGPAVFRQLIAWAREFGHQEVVLHLLDSRREYRFLTRLATHTCRTRLLGRDFTTYRIAVGRLGY